MDFFRKAGDIWRGADRAVGGWLPGGGTASPLTALKQKGEREMATRINNQNSQYTGQTGRFANKGSFLNALTAITEAKANPVAVALGDSAEVGKVSKFYSDFPNLQNQYDLNTNLFLRYLSGTGASGLKVTPEVGRQLYSDIKTQEQKFNDRELRDLVINSPNNPSYIKENILKGRTPVYYHGSSDAVVPFRTALPTDIGERWQLNNSLGSFWADPKDSGDEYTIKNERYNFRYAPENKEGVRGASEVTRAIPASIADFGRGLVRSGYGTPFTYSLDVNKSGNVRVNQ